jgi:hypothetical protein
VFRILCPELAGHLGYDTDGEAKRVATLAEAEHIASDESRGGAVLVQIVDVETGEVIQELPQQPRAAGARTKRRPAGR